MTSTPSERAGMELRERVAMTTAPGLRDRIREAIATIRAKEESRSCRTLDEAHDYQVRTRARILSCNEPDELADAILSITDPQAVRKAALEEAALKCDGVGDANAYSAKPLIAGIHDGARICARGIRALAASPAPTTDTKEA